MLMSSIEEKQQLMKDLLKEKNHLINENCLLKDHLLKIVQQSNTTPSQEDGLSGEENELLEYGDKVSLEQLESYIAGKEQLNQLSSPVGSIISTTKEGINESGKNNTLDTIDSNNIPLGDIISTLLPRLNAEEKNEIASKENSELHHDIEDCKYSNGKILDEFGAAYDEFELRIGEVRRDRADFQRDVMNDAHGKANAQKVLKFLEANIKYKVSKAKKVAERNQALRVVISRTDKQLGMKKELADVLHAVDFEHLHIHKQQNQQKLLEKTQELHRLKTSHAKASEMLEHNLYKLSSFINKQNQALIDLDECEPQLMHVKKNIQRVKLKKEHLEELFHIFVQERDAQLGESQPTALDYMQLKDQAAQVMQENTTWIQKVEVAELCSKPKRAPLT